MTAGRKPRVLVLARNFPNEVLPGLGLWTERLVRVSAAVADPVVIAPVPYVPPVPVHEYYRRYRRIPEKAQMGGIELYHPRVPAGPGYVLHGLDGWLQYPAVKRIAEHLHRSRGIDIIHAHFIYPDGVIAARLGKRFGVPVVSSEHAAWLPWLAKHRMAAAQVRGAVGSLSSILIVSEWMRAGVRAIAGPQARVEVFPNVVDDEVFKPAGAASGDRTGCSELLFVGAIRHVKGFDVLVRALGLLASRTPEIRLRVIGSAFYREWKKDETRGVELARELGVLPLISFDGQQSPAQVAEAMRRAAVVVVPSRREAFGAVVVEALAAGTPVVATRSGGPDTLVPEEAGRLVPVEDPAALAAGVEDVLSRRDQFDPSRLHQYASSRFGRDVTAERFRRLYTELLQRNVTPLPA